MNPRRLHPLTPVAKAAKLLPILLLLVVLNSSGMSLGLRIGLGGGAIVLIVVAVGGISYVQWRNFSFWFDHADDFRVDSGVFQHSRQKVQLSRLQSVEVTQPVFARILGLAEVTVEVAGGGGSRVALSYLGRTDADALRNELLARAAGVDAATPAAPERVLTTVPAGTLLLSLLLQVRTVVLFMLSGFLLLTAFATGGVGALLAALVTGGLPVFQVVAEFLHRYGFTVAESPDGLRIRHGLTSTAASTVPPGRVHAVGFSSGPIWRRLGWVRVQVDLGGNPGAGRNDEGRASTVLLPVSSWPVARDVVAHVLPGVDLRAVEWGPIPERARWRSPIQWGRVGVASDDRYFMARRGRLEQWWTVVPHGRVQSLRVEQGPWERRLDLATLHLDTVPGPVAVRVPHMDATTARVLAEQEADRARAARASDGPDRWMRRTT